MTDSRRIKGRHVAIDYDATQSFFESRGQREYSNLLSATMYQDREPDLVEARDLAEKAAVASVLGLSGVRRVLDIGCGIGRWGWFLAERCPRLQYLGLDFSASLIGKAQQEAERRGAAGLSFQVMSATDIRGDELVVPGPFDLLLISGLLIYLNDSDCVKVLRDAARFCTPGGAIYLREPVGVSERFTLDRYYSEELADEYSAIYRTVDELYAMMNESFAGMNVTVEREGFLFPDGLEKRVETRQYFFVLRRDGEQA
ncbi:class I SAM-dependent methyltransferase [Ectopseudomonas hydrolytica]|uniref:Methyltransferase type 12 n=1 Tax=Ectopseudomonas mendocina (strain ymp) TaxID=399739 RepID=A4XW78_ECTM1|nr:class I SAM-dependent methyltransferase [Pseudomonas hydrolytica]MBF8162467.1 class I SAM-dependent methyltransferase [Pseudomonas mendocina]UTH33365.1 class I SAM-dependent methyltransferase [Pseudomonas hydrolytica]UZZ12637.1 class I SAM-dependent methyltransferase [Pseudomonas mendocina]